MDSQPHVEEFDELATLRFFYKGLRNTEAVCLPKVERAHVASILASYAHASSLDASFLPPLNDLSEFYKHFGFYDELRDDLSILVNASAQNLFLNGFFRDQMKRRYNVYQHDRIGQSLYDRASKLSEQPEVSKLFTQMAENFPLWALACCELQRKLRENLPNPYLLRLQ